MNAICNFAQFCLSETKKSIIFADITVKFNYMAITNTPRTLVYNDIEKIDYFLGSESERTLEREFYERLIKRPFVKSSDNPASCVLSVFNNARYIFYMVDIEENDPSLCFNVYLTKAAGSTVENEFKKHITAATMALVYNWVVIYFSKSKDAKTQKLYEKIYHYFSEEGEIVTDETIKDFHDLLLKKCTLPTNIGMLVDDVREIEDAAINAPIQDVAIGVDYLMECYDPQNGSNGEHYLFLNKILKRFEDEKYSANDSEIIQSAIAKINRRLLHLESAPEPQPLTYGLSMDDISNDVSIGEKEIDPEIRDNIEWILDSNKAQEILETLWQYMEGKTKPKDLLMPLCAAQEAGVIRKPTWAEYKIVFDKHPLASATSLNEWICSEGARKYNRTQYSTYNNLLKKLKEIKEK